MEINEFRKLLRDEEFTRENGGCALALATDSDKESTVIIKGDADDLHTLLLAAMHKSHSVRGCILKAAQRYIERNGLEEL